MPMRDNLHNHQTKAPIICVLLEIYQREIDVKLYFALHALSRGYRIIITEQNTPIARNIENCIIFNKDHAAWSTVFFRNKVKRNIVTCALDEEALIVGDIEIYKNSRISDKVLGKVDAVFAWGEDHSAILRENTPNPDSVFVTGNPKFDLTDLYQSPPRTENTVRKILVNTRFSFTNPKVGNVEEIIKKSMRLGYVTGQIELEKFNNMIESDRQIEKEFESFVRLVGANPDMAITIRPHPAEDDAVYHKLSQQYKNVTVDRFTDLRTQMVEHDCVVHDGCTTAIEAYAIGLPVFGLRPNGLLDPYDDFSNQFSINFLSAEGLYSYLVGRKSRDLDFAEVDKRIDGKIANLRRESLNSCETMMSVIDRFNIPAVPPFKPSWRMRLDLKQRLYDFFSQHSLMSRLGGRVLPSRFERFMDGMATSDGKFPDVDAKHISNEIARIQELDDRFADMKIQVQRVGRKTYQFSRLN